MTARGGSRAARGGWGAILGLVVLLGGTGRADAQVRPRPAAPDRVGVRGFVLFDQTAMTASGTFDATLGSSSLQAPGAGLDVLHLWRGLFARVAFSRVRESGERVVVFGDQVFGLGIPMRVEMTPLEVGGGWRTSVDRAGRFGVYGGGGVLRVRFRQTSDFATASEDVDETFAGTVLFAGVDATLARWVVVGAEGQYRRVPDALGDAGASKAFGETDLGGMTLRLLVGIRY